MVARDLRLRDAGIKQAQCSATNRAGVQCKRHSVTGATVCATHGGRAPQVRDAGLRRTADEIQNRMTKAWSVIDDALDEGNTDIAWKLISAKATLEARAEEAKAEAENIGEVAVLDSKGRPVDPAWAQYAVEPPRP